MQAQTVPVSQALGMEVSGKRGNEAKRSRRREVDGLEGGRSAGQVKKQNKTKQKQKPLPWKPCSVSSALCFVVCVFLLRERD
jgi:hypothetical protein